MNLVAEWITMSAPHRSGGTDTASRTVLSTISGNLVIVRDDATVSISSTLAGWVADRPAEERLVFGAPAFRHASGSSGSTHVSSTFILRNRCLSWFTPPYSAAEETTWSPGSAA
jgi:hypothetical protein